MDPAGPRQHPLRTPLVGSAKSPRHKVGAYQACPRRELCLRPQAPGLRRTASPEVPGHQGCPHRYQADLPPGKEGGGPAFQALSHYPHRIRPSYGNSSSSGMESWPKAGRRRPSDQCWRTTSSRRSPSGRARVGTMPTTRSSTMAYGTSWANMPSPPQDPTPTQAAPQATDKGRTRRATSTRPSLGYTGPRAKPKHSSTSSSPSWTSTRSNTHNGQPQRGRTPQGSC